MLGLDRELIGSEPRPFWLLFLPDGQEWPPPTDWEAFLVEIDPTYMTVACFFRGVEISRLPAVLSTGIDREPPDAPFFAADSVKAWEYGGWPKLLMALDPERMKRSWRRIGRDAPQAEVEQLRLDYPTVRDDDDGQHLLLSRLPDSDTRAGTGYEKAYGFWVPSHQLGALRALFVLVRPTEYVQLHAWAHHARCNELRDAVAARMSPRELAQAEAMAASLANAASE